MKVKRTSAGLRVDLPSVESALLGTLLADLADLLTDDDVADPAIRRLYPDGYADDEAAAAEYRSLVADDLRSERTGRIAACTAELPVDGGRIVLTPEAVDRWLRVLNDLRLVLGTRLGVSEDEELDPAEESSNLYHWLSAIQEMLVMHVTD